MSSITATFSKALAAFALFVCAAFACAQSAPSNGDVQPVPALTARVVDQAATLNATDKVALEDKLAAFEREHGTQIVVLLVPTTQPEDIASYAQRVGDTWKIGRRSVGDGVLIVVAKADRKVRIEVAKALEGAVPDASAKRIIRENIGPSFAKGDYAGGLNGAVDALTLLVEKEKLPGVSTGNSGNTSASGNILSGGLTDFLLPALFAGVMASFFLSRILGRFLGTVGAGGVAGFVAMSLSGSLLIAVGAGLAALFIAAILGVFGAASSLARGGAGTVLGRRGRGGPIIFGGGGFGGGGGGFGGGGGGFSSGGGGDFGGGGASGDW
jgi:uncharacterized protein